jgi:hypothetical protein
VKLSTSDADVASAKERKRQRILQQAPQRESMIVALYPNDSHKIRQHPHGRFRTIDFCFDRQFLRARRLHIDRLARPPAKAAGRFDGRLCVRQRVSDRLMFNNGVNAASPFVTREIQCELKRCPRPSQSWFAKDQTLP